MRQWIDMCVLLDPSSRINLVRGSCTWLFVYEADNASFIINYQFSDYYLLTFRCSFLNTSLTNSLLRDEGDIKQIIIADIYIEYHK